MKKLLSIAWHILSSPVRKNIPTVKQAQKKSLTHYTNVYGDFIIHADCRSLWTDKYGNIYGCSELLYEGRDIELEEIKKEIPEIFEDSDYVIKNVSHEELRLLREGVNHLWTLIDHKHKNDKDENLTAKFRALRMLVTKMADNIESKQSFSADMPNEVHVSDKNSNRQYALKFGKWIREKELPFIKDESNQLWSYDHIHMNTEQVLAAFEQEQSE